MKKNILNLVVIALIATTSIYTGCKKPDNKAPVVTLNGSANQTLSLQGTYIELNATATDEKDGALTPTMLGTVNRNKTGTYTLTYTATDAAGNAGTATRTVTIVNDAAARTGTYQCTITSANPIIQYNQIVVASTTQNKRIHFSRFGNYLNNTNIYANVSDSNLTIPSQFAIQIDSIHNVADRTFYGSGLLDPNGFTLNYTDSVGVTPTSKVETFVKQ